MASLLSKERIVAAPGHHRWLIPPCALATHLCIGQAYALSVFNLPLTPVDHLPRLRVERRRGQRSNSICT
jgi:hypothetical protein